MLGEFKVSKDNLELATFAGGTGHVEVVQITFQPDIFPYEKLLELF